MMGKGLFFVLAAGAILLLQFAECITGATPSRQTMQCCRSMPCTPANKSHDCCKTMISAHTPSMVPMARVSLEAPTVTVVEYPATHEIARFTPLHHLAVEAQQHSPPELYTLNVSLLI